MLNTIVIAVSDPQRRQAISRALADTAIRLCAADAAPKGAYDAVIVGPGQVWPVSGDRNPFGVIRLVAARDPKARITAINSGADEVVPLDAPPKYLRARLRNLLRRVATRRELAERRQIAEGLGLAEAPASFAPPAPVAVLAAGNAPPMPPLANVTYRYMAGHGDAAEQIASGTAALVLFASKAEAAAPTELLARIAELRAVGRLRRVPVMLGVPPGHFDAAALALDTGIADVFETDASPAEIAARLSRQVRLRQEISQLQHELDLGLQLATKDPLTGLHNRRYALSRLGRLADEAALSRRSYCLMMLDIDRFKDINDRYGHLAGDDVLVALARLLQENLREMDLIARIGGEEFLVAMPDTNANDGLAVAERLRAKTANLDVSIGADRQVRLTISIGLAICGAGDHGGEPVARQIDRADRALFQAKSFGRNSVQQFRAIA